MKNFYIVIILLFYCLLLLMLTAIPPQKALSQEINPLPIIEKQDTTRIDSLVQVANSKLDNLSEQTKKAKKLSKTAEKLSRDVHHKNINVKQDTVIIDTIDNRNFFQRLFGLKKNK